MKNKPDISVGEWLTIGNTDCVVSRVYPDGSMHDLEVVYEPTKPTNQEVNWKNGQWEFAYDMGGYADTYNRLAPYVRILKKGRYA